VGTDAWIKALRSTWPELDAVRAKQSVGEPDQAQYDWFAESCPCGLPCGECKLHPRAREAQRPPEGSWAAWLVLAGRGFGKTRTGAAWCIDMARRHPGCRIALVAATVADAREVMVEGESGVLAISPPNFTPLYEPSKRRLTWPNGSMGTTYSAEKPRQLRGPQNHFAWCDEISSWEAPETYDMLLFGLRLGIDPRHCITTTPKATPLVKRLFSSPTTVKTGGSTYDNRQHLAASFFSNVIASYEGSRLGRQEIHAEILELTEAVWFANFDRAKHVSHQYGEYTPGLPVHLAIDCGTSQFTGAVFFQILKVDADRRAIVVFGDYFSAGSYSAKTAEAIRARSLELPSKGMVDVVRLDPASAAHTGIGIAAFNEYRTVFGDRVTSKWPSHRVVDGLDFMEMMLDRGLLIMHPRCEHLIEAFVNYRRDVRAGVVMDKPADPQNPHEDMMDALRGGIRDVFPEGNRVFKPYDTVAFKSIF
jgi:hypothetical protein